MPLRRPQPWRFRRWLGRALLACLLLALRPSGATEPGSGSGLVVESVAPTSAAAAAGFAPGDRLLRWTFPPGPHARRPASGTLATPFDLFELFIETLPRGEVDVHGLRQGRAFTWRFRSTGSQVFGLKLRPARTPDGAGGSPRLAAWYLLRDAESALATGRAEAAERAFGDAAEGLRRAADPSAQAMTLGIWADDLRQKGEAGRARVLADQALALERQRGGADLAVAYYLGARADLSDAQGDRAASEHQWLARLALLEKAVPGSLEVARTLDTLGYLALWRGDTVAAQERLTRSEALQRAVAADTFNYASTLNKLALLAQALGHLERAEELQRRVLALDARWVPGSRDHGGALMNLATTMALRGELAGAEELLHQSAALFDRPGGDPGDAAGPYVDLGELALYRDDLAAAQSYLEVARSRLEADPQGGSPELYSDLAEVARRQGRVADARALAARALAQTEPPAAGDLARAERLAARARRAAEENGNLARAEALLRRATTAILGAAPESADASAILRDHGRLLAQMGRLPEAEALYRQTLNQIARRGLSGTREESAVLRLLGDAERRRGDLAAAEASFCRAAESLDRQRLHLGGGVEAQSWFESETESYSFDCLAARMARGRSAAAFQALEHGRARLFLQLLAERDLRFAELPPGLKAERERLDAEYDRTRSRLAEMRPEADGGGETARLRAHLHEIKAAKEALLAELRRQSPRLAALQAPQPMDLAAARATLDPGTVLLAYAVGPEFSYLFVVTPENEGGRGLAVHRLPLGRAALQREIAVYRRLVTDPQSDTAVLDARAARLYARLLRTAEASLARARRLLISADGPLHLVPWAALRQYRRHGRHGRQGRYLAERWPVHLIASATLYGETRRARRPAGDPATWRLVAFGAAESTRLAGPARARFAAVRSGSRLDLAPLPAARDEIRAIAALFPRAQVYLGREATEENARRAAPHADLLHFAGHGLIDEHFPLDSALALARPAAPSGRDNGLLQAWEIFESLRLDASLVTLSACDTALGDDMGGEGLLGLARAFQFAGARSVLASLWSVSDVSTAELMERFYTYLRRGESKDEALRKAQLDLIRSGRGGLAHPYHWAGFALYGDWR